ncbi:MAG: hypothetical protein HKN47_00260 [Pirellulaceae bacterium]|nr:hypothetical protein [Pirellulaceae bacterium]
MDHRFSGDRPPIFGTPDTASWYAGALRLMHAPPLCVVHNPSRSAGARCDDPPERASDRIRSDIGQGIGAVGVDPRGIRFRVVNAVDVAGTDTVSDENGEGELTEPAQPLPWPPAPL